MDFEEVKKQINELEQKGARFFLAYDGNGEAMAAIPIGDCTKIGEPMKGCVPIDFLDELRKNGESCIEVKTTAIIYAHSSEKKSCYIPLTTGGYICICCH